MALPLDAVKAGDWLIMLRGPYVTRFTQIGEDIKFVNKEPEGVLHKVLAVSAPFVLVKVFPVPCEDPAHPFHPPFNVTWNWNEVQFIRPSRQYLREYLKRGRPKQSISHGRERPRPNKLLGPHDFFGQSRSPLPPETE